MLAKSEGAKGSSLTHAGGNSALQTAGSRQSCADSGPVAAKPVGRKPMIEVVGSSKEASAAASAENMDTSMLKP